MLGASRIRHAPLVAFGAYENTQIHSLLLRNPANIISSARSALHLHHQRLDSHAPALSLNLSKIAGVLLLHNTTMHTRRDSNPRIDPVPSRDQACS
jgi:hypothetical protein